jgi:hypothetical protein
MVGPHARTIESRMSDRRHDGPPPIDIGNFIAQLVARSIWWSRYPTSTGTNLSSFDDKNRFVVN